VVVMDGAVNALGASVPLQSFRERLPSPPLREIVTCVWIQQVGNESPPYRHRTIPNGSAELVCAPGSMPRIVGPKTGPTEELVAPGTVTVGVRFRPAFGPTLLGPPAVELVDLEMDADDVWGRWAIELGERLAACTSPQAACPLLERELTRRARDCPQPDWIAVGTVGALLHRQSGVHALAMSLDVSERQLRRRCESAIGVTPKVLERMFRFQRFLALANANGAAPISLARLALEAGYADQSHLTRESVRLAGRPPAQLLADAAHDCRCVHDHSASWLQFIPDAVAA
jgi:AraC-like DNA-binding protein